MHIGIDMEEPSGLESDFRCALRRIDNGLLSHGDIIAIIKFLKRIRTCIDQGNETNIAIDDVVIAVVKSFNKSMYKKVLLNAVPVLERCIKNVLKNLKGIIHKHGDPGLIAKLLQCDGLGLLNIALVTHNEHRSEQLSILKSLIGDAKFVLSPVFARMISQLLREITADEFQTYLAQEILRLLKRGHKGVIFTIITLQKHLRYDVMVPIAVDIIENVKSLLSQRDVSLFGSDITPLGNLKRMDDVSHTVKEIIHWFSNAVFVTKGSGMYKYIKTQLDSFDVIGRNSVADQEIVSLIILLLIPDSNKSVDPSLVEELCNASKATLIKTANSHPSESVQMQFINIIGSLLRLYPNPDLEGYITDVILNQAKGLTKVGSKNPDKLNEKILTCALRSLRFSVGTDCVNHDTRGLNNPSVLITALNDICNFCHGKPVYKNTLVEALYLKLQLETANPQLSGGIKIQGILETLQPHHQDLLAHLYISKVALVPGVEKFNEPESLAIMELDTVPSIIEAAQKSVGNRMYAIMVELYEEICKNKDHLRHPVTGCYYDRNYIESQLKGFTDAIKEHHVYGLLIAILHCHQGVKCMNTLKMLRDVCIKNNYRRRVFTTLISCILFDGKLSGFEDGSYLTRIITYRSCRPALCLKSYKFNDQDIFDIVCHCISEGHVPFIFDHYLASQGGDVSPLLGTILGRLKASLDELALFEREDIAIYFARADKLYPDSRPFQPNVHQPDKKKNVSLTKQQLDEMRYKEQCIIRSKIAKVVNEVNAAIYSVSRGLAHNHYHVSTYLRDILAVCRYGIGLPLSYYSLSRLLMITCNLSFSGKLCRVVPRLLEILKNIYSHCTHGINYDDASTLMDEVTASTDLTRECSLIIAEVAMFILGDSNASTGSKQASLRAIITMLTSMVDLEQKQLLDTIRSNLRNQELYPYIRDTLSKAAHYLLDIDGLADICKMGLSTQIDLVKDAVSIYTSGNASQCFSSVMEYLIVLGVSEVNLQCSPRRIIDLVPTYIHDNSETLEVTTRVLVQYPPGDVIDSLLGSLDKANDDDKESLLGLLKYYVDRAPTNLDHFHVFTKLAFTTGIAQHMGTTLECCNILAQTVPKDDTITLVTRLFSWIIEYLLDGNKNAVLSQLRDPLVPIVGISLLFLGYVQANVEYTDTTKWSLELLVALLSSDNEFSRANVKSHAVAVVTSLARKCALEGEEEMLNSNITDLLAKSAVSEFAIVPCVALLKGGGLSYLKKHGVMAKIKESMATKTNSNSLKMLKEVSIQFDRLFDPYVKDIFPGLVACFNDNYDLSLDAAISIVGVLTPVGLKSILSILIESLENYVSSIKLGCLITLSHVIKDPKLHGVIIKNVCDVVKSVSPCTTDTQRAVKEAADGLLDSIVGLAGESSILYPTMGSILKVLSHPSESNVTATMHVLLEYSKEHPNIGAETIPIGVVELGLLEPILSRALRSRNGECRQSAIVFSSWLVSRCGGSREVELFFTGFMPILTELLKDTLPDIRKAAATAIGSCANSFKRFGCETSRVLIVDLINCLTKCVMESATSLERRSGAAGLAQALCAVEDEFVHAIVTKLFKVLDCPDSTPQMREGCLALFNDLPVTCYGYVQSHIGDILHRVMAVLCDEDERVREMSSRVMRTMIERYHSTDGDIVLDAMKFATRSSEWQCRNLVLPLLQYLNTLSEDNRVIVELYIARFDTNATVKATSVAIWKGVNVTRSLRQIFPLLLPRVIEMLEQDDSDVRIQAGECISDAVVRLGTDAVNEFIKAILQCEGAFRGRCIGIASLAANGKIGIEEHLPGILDFLKMCLCRPGSCEEASSALASLAGYFPSVVSEVLPSLVKDLFGDGDSDTYLTGITLLIEQHSECFEMILQEALSTDLNIIRLALLERILCAKRAKVVFSRQAVLTKCIKQLLVYNNSYPTETLSSFTAFVTVVKAECVIRLIQILIEMLNDLAKEERNNDKSCIIIFIATVIELREAELDGNYGSIAESLARYIFCDSHVVDPCLIVFDQMIKSAERRTELDRLIATFARFFGTLTVPDHVSNPSLVKTLPLMMSLVQKGFVKSNAKIEAAMCVTAIHKLVGPENMGPFILKTIGAIIRCLNDKCPSSLKIALLEAIQALLHCETVHIRVILYQLQSALFKCLTDVNSDVNMLIGPNLYLYVQLAPNKADSVVSELMKLAFDRVTKPSVKTASLYALNEVLRAKPVLNPSPFDKLLNLFQDSNGSDKQYVCQSIGLCAQLEGDIDPQWLKDLCILTSEDPTALTAFSGIVSGIRGFTQLYENATKEFVDMLRHNIKSDVPSMHLPALEVFCRISKLTPLSQLARDFVKSYIGMVPSGSKLPPSGQSQVLQIYKRLLRFDQNIANFASQLMYLSEAIYGSPLVKLEAEKVLLVLLGPSRDLHKLQTFIKQHSTSDKVEKLLVEYSTRVLVKGNKVDQLSDYEV
ncbi:HEAT repeat family protein [Babesia bovis T2Bo]|uniref:HEAT repeat family protein n=1 Tax=Babesia bovis TaxID=5865 RepID=A7ATT6_BABBO|nr:HEAT repeat family protein [Babesia bovis T2Bo]EDO06347.1 HEAT repeat family protein [Babesia bovis T2Bo]|eukprot:XP_001609915.1 HEAT repeat family protein [Babesia bovis T2Bo]